MIALLARITGVSPLVIEAAIIGAILLAFAGVGLKVYKMGYDAADAKCEAAALQSKIEAMEKDRDDARAAAADAKLRLAAIDAQTKDEQERTAQYVADLERRASEQKPEGAGGGSCELTCDDLRGMRISSKACPALPGPAPAVKPDGARKGPFRRSAQ